jgi:predicted nucleic acid-binding protein
LSIYADTSFFVSLYLTDRHTREAERRMVSKPLLWLSPLHRAEWVHAIEQHIFQRQMSPREAQRVHAAFERDRMAGLWAEVALPDAAFDLCAQLARRHVARLGTRTLDTLHVACALELQAKQFWTFDHRQARLARAEGLNLGNSRPQSNST